MNMQDEITKLQTTLAFQEHTISELNEALLSQQKQIDLLRLELRLLQERLADLEAGGELKARSAAEERPPHY